MHLPRLLRGAPTHHLDERVDGHAMRDDTEQHGPAGREHDLSVAGQLFVENENREKNGDPPARAKLADEQVVRGARSRTDQARKEGKHPDHRQAQRCIEERRPSDTVDQAGDTIPRIPPMSAAPAPRPRPGAAQRLLLVTCQCPYLPSTSKLKLISQPITEQHLPTGK